LRLVRKKHNLQSHSSRAEQENAEHYQKIAKWKEQPLPSEAW